MTTPHIGIIIGSTREGRFSEHAAHWIAEKAKVRTDMTGELIDLREYHLPFLESKVNPSHQGGIYPHPEIARFAEKMRGLDGYLVVTPEYNRSTSAVLKNAFDVIYGEFAQKPIAFVSYGSVGGARAVEHLRLTAIEQQMAPIRSAVHIMAPWTLREADGSLKEGALESYAKATADMLDQLAWWVRALRVARSNTPSSD